LLNMRVGWNLREVGMKRTRLCMEPVGDTGFGLMLRVGQGREKESLKRALSTISQT